MMRAWSVAASLVLCAGAALAAPAPGAPGPGPHGGQPGMGGMHGGMGGMRAAPGRMGGRGIGMGSPAAMLLMHRQMLNLTDQQVERLQNIHVEAQKQAVRQMADVRIAQIDLMQLLSQPNPDRRRIEDAARDLGRRMTEVHLARVRSFLDAWDVLTPEQRQQVRSMMGPMGMGGCPMCAGMMGMGGGAGMMGGPPMMGAGGMAPGAGAGGAGH
ncbi:MAG: periplasmic heavy metal sensor [Armatimonadetes bacterium]|nr:periplasmic heavy metal sensor [Armatimonadota bacterium]